MNGFCAGRNMVFAAAFHQFEEKLRKNIHVAGVISFYSLVDRTLMDHERYQADPLLAERGLVPEFLLNIFANSYTGPGLVDLKSYSHQDSLPVKSKNSQPHLSEWDRLHKTERFPRFLDGNGCTERARGN
jgi:hypothetical protein